MKEKMLWNKERDASVKASKVREITISPEMRSAFDSGKTHVEVRGWFNKNEDFIFGWFDTKEEATLFVEALHSQIES